MSENRTREKLQLLPCNENDVEVLEQWLEDMARQGYILRSILWHAATFEVGEPCNIRYRLLPRKKQARIDWDGAKAENEMIASLGQEGWHYVTWCGEYFVFSAHMTDVVEPERDIQEMHQKTFRSVRFNHLIILGLFLFIALQALLPGFGRIVLACIKVGTEAYMALLIGTIVLAWLCISVCVQQWNICKRTQVPNWKETATLRRIRTVLSVIMFVVLIFVGLWGLGYATRDHSWQPYEEPISFPLLQDLPHETEYTALTVYARQRDDLLVPIIIQGGQSGIYTDDDGLEVADTLDIYYYETIAPWIAMQMAKEYPYEDGMLWRELQYGQEPNPIELRDLGVDYAVVYTTYEKVLVLVKDNVVMRIAFFDGERDLSSMNMEQVAKVYADYLLAQ